MRVGIVGSEANRLLEMRDRIVRTTGIHQRPSEIQVHLRFRLVGLEYQGLVQVIDGVLRPAESDQRGSQVVVRHGVVGLDRQRALQLRDRLLRPAETVQQHAEVVERARVLWVEPERVLELRHRLPGRFPCIHERHAEVVVSHRIIGLVQHGVPPDRDGTFVRCQPVHGHDAEREDHGQHRRSAQTCTRRRPARGQEPVSTEDRERDDAGQRQIHAPFGSDHLRKRHHEGRPENHHHCCSHEAHGRAPPGQNERGGSQYRQRCHPRPRFLDRLEERRRVVDRQRPGPSRELQIQQNHLRLGGPPHEDGHPVARVRQATDPPGAEYQEHHPAERQTRVEHP